MSAGDSGDVVVFDFLSHEAMHHPFNEGYVRVLASAYPGSTISFYAGEGQVGHLRDRLADLSNATLQPCATFVVPFGLSRHNPVAGRWAARRCLRTIAETISGGRPKLVSVLGVDANLLAVLKREWLHISSAPLHMILHSHLGDAFLWRSHNPLIRRADFLSQLQRPLPAQIRLIVLELGIKSAIVELAPHLASSVATLEHPNLRSEWGSEDTPPDDGKLTIAFLGHARPSKGFPAFVELARQCRQHNLDFQAIGHASPGISDADLSVLSRPPSLLPLTRREYLDALHRVDFVCLPFHSRVYDFTASGVVTDAVTALRPLLALRNRTLVEIQARYGPVGYLVDTLDEMIELVRTIEPVEFAAQRAVWIQNLARIREARQPEILGKHYDLSADQSTEIFALSS